MTKLNAEAVSNLSVAELLELGTDQMETMGFKNYPKGFYHGSLLSFTLPNPDDDIDWFEVVIQPMQAIELADEEQLADAQELLDDSSEIKLRYYMGGKGYGILNMNTDFEAPLQAAGSLGNFIALCAEGAVPINFTVKHRVTTPPKGSTPEQVKAFEAKTYVEATNVQLAE